MIEVNEVTKATESGMLTAVCGTTTPDEINEFNKSHCDYLEKYNYSEDDFDPEDGQIHTGMTNEEWLEKNNKSVLEHCKKCPMWEKCRTAEKTLFSYKGLTHKMTEQISKEIDKDIAERLRIEYEKQSIERRQPQ